MKTGVATKPPNPKIGEHEMYNLTITVESPNIHLNVICENLWSAEYMIWKYQKDYGANKVGFTLIEQQGNE